MTFNGMMEPGPWYHDGVEVNVDDVPEDDILYDFIVRVNHPALTVDGRSNFAVPSQQFALWLRTRGWDNETVRISPMINRSPQADHFEVIIMFENKRAAQLFKLMWI